MYARTDTPWVRLVCFPHSGGSAPFFRPWRAYVPPGVELYAVQYPGRLGRSDEPLVDDMETLANQLARDVYHLCDRPVAFFGHSLGALVGYEVARRLRGYGPVRLVASAHVAPGRHRPGRLHLATDDVLWAELRRLGGTATEVLAEPEVRRAFLPVLRNDYRLVESYRPTPGARLACPVSVFLGSDDPDVAERDAVPWAEVTTGGCALRRYPGHHFYLVERAPHVVADLVALLAEDCRSH